jgi:hypothetical protein
MKNGQKKISKVMKEFKKGELNIGQSSKKVKSPKQAIAIALSEAGMSRKPMAKGGSVNSYSKLEQKVLGKSVDVEMTNPQETQIVEVGGQRAMLPEKKRKAKWY